MSRGQDVDKLSTFADGVIMVAMTLLVLDVRLPRSPDTLDDAMLGQELIAIWPKYLGYIVSFLVIASFWISHTRKLRRVVRIDRTFIWLDVLFLLCIGFVPFATTVVSESAGRLSTQLYAGLMALTSICLAALWRYAVANRLTDQEISEDEARVLFRQPLSSAAIFLASGVVAVFAPIPARLMWLLIIPSSLGWRRKSRRSDGGAFG